MKPRDVQRSVRAQRIDRSAGDAPSIGRVGRMPGTGMPKGERRRRKRGERSAGDRTRNNRTKVMLTWSAVLVGLALAGMGLAVWLWMRSNMQRRTVIEQDEVPVIQERVVSQFASPTEAEALALVKKALAISEPAAVTECFRTGSASPAEVVEFLRKMAETDGKISGMDWLRSLDANGLLLEGVLVNFSNASGPRNRLALLTPDDKGTWKIDFDAFARTVKPSWSELMAQKTGSGLVRVIVGKDSYYNGLFRDESKWACYAMATPDHEAVLLGYCRKGSPQAAAMERIVADDNLEGGRPSLKRATLEIRRIAGAESRQFEIARVLAEDWVVSGRDFEENFK